MAHFMLISVLVGTYMCIVQGQSSCKTPSGGRGTCVSLYNCSPLMAVINQPTRSQDDIKLLRESQCGFQALVPQVCCASNTEALKAPSDETCFTPDAQTGKCTSLYNCYHLAKILQRPVSKETIAFVQSSRCEGSEQYSVCCGESPPDINNKPTPSPTCQSTVAPPDPRSGCCGVESMSTDRIFGGEATALDQYPWLVIIEYHRGNQVQLMCGGVLISGRYVLTAGHCVIGKILRHGIPRYVRLGEYDISNDVNEPDCVPANGGGQDCSKGVTVIAIEKTIPHPQYNPRAIHRYHDIALLKLRTMAPYADLIRPICLPQIDVTQDPPKDFLMYVAGWGAISETILKSKVKKHVDVPFQPLKECQPAYRVQGRNTTLWDGQMCAGGVKNKDSCKGDSGGPLMWENGKTFELVGVVSFGPKECGLENVPGIYTKVYEYMPWIRSNVQP